MCQCYGSESLEVGVHHMCQCYGSESLEVGVHHMCQCYGSESLEVGAHHMCVSAMGQRVRKLECITCVSVLRVRESGHGSV